ncbi:nicotinate (nicotinamide) nucleotide adenylyltransferase [Deminuibacter soli]|uniref:Probable nicotinate-nucleotide adenylyltransferase n=1 Tax=Deminuibacter soli TaxID=2291815 RepID=A0A3E1NQV4_9BACT|nr:nicotinate (nicotinamide) nucleotide adenylyltransferase [Deminuibacter soli]RFM30312.1 nicotinate-nucleotide adenylyltransferase [Deminuibacter soli]
MKVGLYFGSFNPIHVGHLIIANYVAGLDIVQQVWLVVSPQNPLKPSAGLLNEYHRLHLTRLAIDGAPNLKVTDVEFKLPKPSYTIDTLTYLHEKYPGHEFVIIMGSDSFQNLPKWKNFDLLKRDYSFIIYNRPGYPVTDTFGTKHTIVDAPLLEISATQVRQMIRDGRSVRYIVPDKVQEEIAANGYYSKKQG